MFINHDARIVTVILVRRKHKRTRGIDTEYLGKRDKNNREKDRRMQRFFRVDILECALKSVKKSD